MASREPAQASEATADPASKPAAGPSSAASAAGAPNDGGGTAGETASSSQQALRDGSAYAQLAVKQFADIATAQMTAFRQTSGAVANGGADIQAVYLSLAQANARAFADYAAALGEVRDPATLLHLQSSLVKSLMEETMGAGMRLSEIGRDLILTGWKVGQEQRAAITETSAGRAR